MAENHLKSLFTGPPRLTLAVAESLTAGRVQARVSAESGASAYFLGGLTAYTLESKVRYLGVDQAEAERSAGVSAKVAEQMALGVCRFFGSDVGVGTTGWAESSAERHVYHPFAWWGVAHWKPLTGEILYLVSGRVDFPGASRAQVQTGVTDAVVVQLASYIRALRGGDRPKPNP